jgi:hypothetical protein
MHDELRRCFLLVIPAALNSGAGQAGIQLFESQALDSRFRRNDG